MDFPGGTSGKNLLPIQETQETPVWSLSGEDPLRRKCQPIPVFLPGESQGQRILASYSQWGHKESDMTEVIWHARMQNPQTYSVRIHSLSRYQVIHTYIKVWEACCEVYLIRMKLGKGRGKYKLSFKFCVIKFLWYTKKEPLSNGCYLDLSTYD